MCWDLGGPSVKVMGILHLRSNKEQRRVLSMYTAYRAVAESEAGQGIPFSAQLACGVDRGDAWVTWPPALEREACVLAQPCLPVRSRF
eukprot:13546446-Alexandrium_andersonii.AAC.1